MILGQHYNKLHELGAGWTTSMSPRLVCVATLHWPDIEISPGLFYFSKSDAVFSKIPDGVEVILSNSGTPRFYSSRPNEDGNAVFQTGTLAEPVDFRKFRTYLRTMKKRYPAIKYVEGPNEPGPGSGYCSSAMPEILNWQRAVWQEFGSSLNVISAPVILTEDGFDTLKGLMATQGLHTVGVHFYSTKLDPMELETALYRVRQIIDRSGNTGKPIAITEMGCNPPPYGIARLRDLPSAVQTSFWESHIPVAAKYAAIIIPFAYDDTDHGWKGNNMVESAMNNLQARYE